MLRSFIPKPKKPGQFRPLTQLAEKDRLVLDALFRLFNSWMRASLSTPMALDLGAEPLPSERR